MPTDREDYTSVSLIKGQDSEGNLVTVAVDASGNIIGVLKGTYNDVPKILATDIDGRILARLMGRYGDTMIDVAVDGGGKLAITEISQSNITGDTTEAQGWTTPIANLLSNLNRIRYAIISMSGEVWGTFTHSIAEIWTDLTAHEADPDAHHTKFTTTEHDTPTRHPLSNLTSEVCSEAEADSKIATHEADSDAHHTKLHKTSHQDGGADELSVTGLSGELADRQKSKTGNSTLGWTLNKLLKGAGAGSNPTEIDIPSYVIWKDASENALTDINRTTTLGWTDLDLTAFTSTNAKFAIIHMRVIGMVCGTAGDNILNVRKNGTTPAYTFVLQISNALPDGTVLDGIVLIGLDSGQVMEYSIVVATGGTIHSYIDVLGYVE